MPYRPPTARLRYDQSQSATSNTFARSEMSLRELLDQTAPAYRSLKSPRRAALRDVSGLLELGAISVQRTKQGEPRMKINLDWPQQIKESFFAEWVQRMPRANTHAFFRE